MFNYIIYLERCPIIYFFCWETVIVGSGEQDTQAHMDLKGMKQQEDVKKTHKMSFLVCTVQLISLMRCEDMPQDGEVHCGLL